MFLIVSFMSLYISTLAGTSKSSDLSSDTFCKVQNDYGPMAFRLNVYVFVLCEDTRLLDR